VVRNLLVAMVIVTALCSPELFARHTYAPLPDKVMKAKTVYLEDRTGYPGVEDKAYQELEKWGRFKVVTNRKGADLILLLSDRAYTVGYMATVNGGSGGYWGIGQPLRTFFGYLTFIDPANGEMVWSEAKRVNWTAGHTLHAMFKELRERIAEQESTTTKK
jgi:hypothetical protein